jgi:outer membrane protein assembly factor BamB
VISSAGSLERLIDLPGGFGHLAAAADGCTIYYADNKVIRRLNACTGVSLPLFSTFAQPVVDLTVLSTGDVLVLTGQNTLVRLNGDGSPAQSFPIQGVAQYGLEAIGISSDESVVGIAAMRGCDFRGMIVVLALTDGRELWRQETRYISSATGLVVGPSAAAAIPASCSGAGRGRGARSLNQSESQPELLSTGPTVVHLTT